MKRLLLTAALLALAGSAHAQIGRPNPDTNGDGKLTLAELKVAQVDNLLKRLDANKDGRISKAESKPMEDLAARFGGAKATAQITRMWTQGDSNKDSVLSRAEMEVATQRRFDVGDTNNDGWLSKDELANMRKTRGRDG